MRWSRRIRLPMRGVAAVAAVTLAVSTLSGCGGGTPDTAALASESTRSANPSSSTSSPSAGSSAGSSAASSTQPGALSSSSSGAVPPQPGQTQPQPTQTQPGRTSSPPPPAGAQYRVVDSLCAHVSLNAMTAVLPHVSAGPADYRTLETIITCTADLGATADADLHGVFFIVMEIYGDAAQARARYDHFRGVNSGFASFADIPGIGDRAFQALVPYVPPAPTVRVQHGNAEFLASWGPVTDDPLPAGIFSALTQTIRNTMTSLQSA